MNKTELVAAMADAAGLSKVPSKYPKEQQEKEEIRRLARPWKSKLPKLRNSKQEKL